MILKMDFKISETNKGKKTVWFMMNMYIALTLLLKSLLVTTVRIIHRQKLSLNTKIGYYPVSAFDGKKLWRFNRGCNRYNKVACLVELFNVTQSNCR